MKIYVPNPSPVTKAFLAVCQLTLEQAEVESVEDADLVFVATVDDLYKQYRPDKFFGFIVAQNFAREQSKKQPNNVFVLDALHWLGEHTNSVFAFARAFEAWNPPKQIQQVDEPTGNITALSRSYFVLVVDDTRVNLETATRRLVGQQLILTTGPEEAMRYLNMPGRKPDAVLTDLQMRPDKTYGALNIDQYGVAETVHSGFALMFEATARGIPVAIVTDGNHHLDWASAMFDRMKSATVNGQKVLFFNNIQKRWDEALKALLEP